MAEPPPPKVAHVAENKQEHFRFFDLPAELRNSILEMALLDTTGDQALWHRVCPENGTLLVVVNSSWRPPALLATSQQLRKEAGDIYFKTSEFRFGYVLSIIKWFEATDKAFRRKVSKLRWCAQHPWCRTRVDPGFLPGILRVCDIDVDTAAKYCSQIDDHTLMAQHDWKSIVGDTIIFDLAGSRCTVESGRATEATSMP